MSKAIQPLPESEHIVDFSRGATLQDNPRPGFCNPEFETRIKACPVTRSKRRIAIMIALTTGWLPWGVEWKGSLPLCGRRYILCCGHTLNQKEAQLFADHGLLKAGDPDKHGRPTLVITDAGRLWLNLRW